MNTTMTTTPRCTPLWMALTSALALGGCASLTEPPAPSSAPVQAVQTDQGLGLACLGQQIERSRLPAVQVFVDPIRDQTVPGRYDERRLSSGGKWWLMTALNQLGTPRVQVMADGAAKADPRNPAHLVLSGAWTQDDHGIAQQQAGLQGLWSRLGLELGARRSFDLIAGDFVSSRQGRVVHASAISVRVSSTRAGLELEVDEGRREWSVGVSGRSNEGPQFAQRRIAEAAVLVHLAQAFGVDHRACLPSS